MSIADLKVRLADVPGIETLSMALEAGRIMKPGRWRCLGAHSNGTTTLPADILQQRGHYGRRPRHDRLVSREEVK